MNKDRSRTARRTYLEIKKANIDYIFWDIVEKAQAYSTTTKRYGTTLALLINVIFSKQNQI